MNTDRELLEDAAKAAGYVLVWGDKYKLGDDEIDCTDIPYIRSGQPDEGDIFWNPFTDDGDALRLVKARHMTVAWEPSRGGWSVGAIVSGEFRWLVFDEDCNRAIVRAAAEIGRSKE